MSELLKKTDLVLQTAVIFLIQGYRIAIAPHFGNCCRFYPSCSVYAQQTIRTRGLVRGIFLTLKRLFKCQPYHPGGIDVVETRT